LAIFFETETETCGSLLGEGSARKEKCSDEVNFGLLSTLLKEFRNCRDIRFFLASITRGELELDRKLLAALPSPGIYRAASAGSALAL